MIAHEMFYKVNLITSPSQYVSLSTIHLWNEFSTSILIPSFTQHFNEFCLGSNKHITDILMILYNIENTKN